MKTPIEKLHHYYVDRYWDEYQNLQNLYKEHKMMVDEVGNRYILNEKSVAPKLKNYFDYLINSDKKCKFLQLNRFAFRLSWVREQYPESVILHLWRNPRDQWASMVLGIRNDYLINELNKKKSFLLKKIPILNKTINWYQFYFLYHKLSKIVGDRYSTYSFEFRSFENALNMSIDKLFDVCKLDDKSKKKAELLFLKKQRNAYFLKNLKWYKKNEDHCEKLFLKEYGSINVENKVIAQIEKE